MNQSRIKTGRKMGAKDNDPDLSDSNDVRLEGLS